MSRYTVDEKYVDGEAMPDELLEIEDAIIKHFEISRILLRSDSRDRYIVNARHMVWYVARNTLGMTLTKIARLYGKDHTTIRCAIRRIIRLNMVDDAYKIVHAAQK